MVHYRILLISVLCLNGCTPEHIDHISAVVTLNSPAESQPDCSQNNRVLNCDWNNVTDDWLNADPSEFNDSLPLTEKPSEKATSLTQQESQRKKQAD